MAHPKDFRKIAGCLKVIIYFWGGGNVENFENSQILVKTLSFSVTVENDLQTHSIASPKQMHRFFSTHTNKTSKKNKKTESVRSGGHRLFLQISQDGRIRAGSP